MKKNSKSKKLVIFASIAILFLSTIPFLETTTAAGPGDTIEWEGITWDVISGNATILGDGSLQLVADNTGNALLHVNRIPGLENQDDPYIEIIYNDTGDSDHKIDMYIEDEAALTALGPGSLWSATRVLPLRYTDGSSNRRETYVFFDDPRQNVEHTVYIGKRTDGTIDCSFDNEWRSSTMLLENKVGSEWYFHDAYLRLRNANDGESTVFKSLDYGVGHTAQTPTTFIVAHEYWDSTSAPMSIQNAINKANSGDTIQVAPGTFDEMLSVNKPLTLNGANAGIHPTVGVHPTETVGTRGDETILSHNGLYAISPSADHITIDGFKFTGAGGRIIDTYADANNFSLLNCIFDNPGSHGQTGNIQFGGGSHNDLLFAYNIFIDGGDYTFYTGGGPFDRMHIIGNKFNGYGTGIFWTASVLVDAIVEYNEFNGTYDGVPGDGGCGMNIGLGGNIIIRDNWFHDLFFTGFQIGIIDGSVIDNTFERIHPFTGYWGDCFELWGGQYGTMVSDNVTIKHNELYYNDLSGATAPTHGIRIRGPESTAINASTIHVHQNNFYDGDVRTDANAIWHQANDTVDAECNWWSDITGPYDAILNPDGLGSDLSGDVDFIPWLDDTYPEGDCVGGICFDPVYVDDDAVSGWYDEDHVSTIQTAVDRVCDGGTIYVEPGTYVEDISIPKSVTIIGSGDDQTFVKSATKGTIMTISSNDVTIQDLEFTDDTQLIEAIRIVSGASSGFTIENVDFTNLGNNPGPSNAYGIVFDTSFTDFNANYCDFTATNLGEYSRASGLFAGKNNGYILNDLSVENSTFTYMYVGIYISAETNGLYVKNNVFGPWELEDCAAAVAGLYMGDGKDNYDLENIVVTGNTFTEYGRGVYSWNYAPEQIYGAIDISDNTFTDSIWSAGIRFYNGYYGTENISYQGPITINDNVFTQSADVGANVAMIDLRTYSNSKNTDITIAGNEITFSGSSYVDAMYGIQFIAAECPFNNTLVENNIISGGNVGGAGTVPSSGINIIHYSDDYWPTLPFEMDILTNNITGFDHGVSIYNSVNSQFGGLPSGSLVNINYNNIFGNTLYGIRNDNAEIVNAECNWWGSASGPTHASNGYNIGFQGESISDNVKYCPYLDDTYPTGVCMGPVQNTRTNEYFCGIQEGIDDADTLDGDTLTIAAGTYQEDAHNWVDIDLYKELALLGAGSDQTIIHLHERNNPAGAHVDGMSISASNVTVDGMTFTKIPGNDYACGFNIRAGINVHTPPPSNTFENIVLRDVESEYSYSSNVIFDGGYTYENVVIENCNIHHSYTERCFYQSPSVTMDGFSVINSHFDHAGYGDPNVGSPIGFNLQGTTNDLTITGGTFNQNPDGGIGIRRTTNAVIEDVLVNHSGYSTWSFSGIGVWEDLGTTTNIQIINPTVTNCGGRGMSFGTWANTVTDISVTGGLVEDSGNEGIMLYAGGDGGVVSAVTIDGVTVNANTNNVLSMEDDGSGDATVIDVTVQHCNITNADNSGVYFTGMDVSGSQVKYNNILNNIAGIVNDGGSGVLDAECNWYGHISGPSGEGPGTGDSVGANIDYIPWLTDAYPDGDCDGQPESLMIEQLVFDRGFPIRHAADGDWGGAQSFSPTSFLDPLSYFTRAELYLRKFGTPEFDLTIELRSGSPAGDLIETVVFPKEDVPTTWTWFSVDFDYVDMDPGIDYFIVIPPAPSGMTTSFGYEWGYAFEDQYDGGSFWFTRDGGDLWRALPTMYEMTFKIYAMP